MSKEHVISVGLRAFKALALLIAVLCGTGIFVLTGSAKAQEMYGPPAPGSSQALAMMSGNGGEWNNPLAILERVGNISGGGSGSGSAATSGRTGLSTAVNIMVVLTVITLAPSLILMTTCFVRILIVLGLLKQAMGTQSIPPPQVTTALALFMTLTVMAPTLDRINAEAITPYRQGEISDYDTLWEKARQPMRDFMFNQIEATGNWSSVYMVLEKRGVDVSAPERLNRSHVDMISLVPAFMLSELKTSFLMGFRIYLPFLVIDLVISIMLISMGMMMLPPVLISLPFKLLLFVLVDGWTLVVGSLMSSFVTTHAPMVSAAAGVIVPLSWT